MQPGAAAIRKHLALHQYSVSNCHVNTLHRPDKAEEDARQLELGSFCGVLLERHEDAVMDALTSEAFSKGEAPYGMYQLCRQQVMRLFEQHLGYKQLPSSFCDASMVMVMCIGIPTTCLAR